MSYETGRFAVHDSPIAGAAGSEGQRQSRPSARSRHFVSGSSEPIVTSTELAIYEELALMGPSFVDTQ